MAKRKDYSNKFGSRPPTELQQAAVALAGLMASRNLMLVHPGLLYESRKPDGFEYLWISDELVEGLQVHIQDATTVERRIAQAEARLFRAQADIDMKLRPIRRAKVQTKGRL